MDQIINNLFSHYLSHQKIEPRSEYGVLSKKALAKEKELRDLLNEEQRICFEQLFELTAQLHYLEVKDAFAHACKLGANASKEFLI